MAKTVALQEDRAEKAELNSRFSPHMGGGPEKRGSIGRRG
jgi:hypothetical protein